LNNLTQRIITGVIGAALMIATIVYGEITFLLLLLFISTMSLLEFYRLAETDGIRPQRLFGILINFCVFLPPLIQLVFNTGFNLLPLVIVLPYFVFIREIYRKLDKPFTNIAYTLVGIIYISLPLFCFYLISFQGILETYQYECILGYLFIIWASDTGAYFSGKYLGRNKLFERISPKKTVEGLVGGSILALAMAYVLSIYFPNFTLSKWLIIAVIIIVTGTLGDLVESMFKRSLTFKDSGSILPGHGGFLDRFDGLYISAPFVFFYLQTGY
jgi:phosphatidate cytidylyltransferase